MGKNKLKIEVFKKFDGKREDLLRFLTKVSLYIEYYDTRFPNEDTKTRYIVLKLTG
jgi:hypothetical protein